jgi:hypothetical protein
MVWFLPVLQTFSNEKLEKCTTCIKEKQTSKAFSKVKGTRARDILGLLVFHLGVSPGILLL